VADSNTEVGERFLFSNMKLFDESYYSKQPEENATFSFKKSSVFNAARWEITDRHRKTQNFPKNHLYLTADSLGLPTDFSNAVYIHKNLVWWPYQAVNELAIKNKK